MNAPYVDHRNPLHDGFCRCTTCKPSPVGARSQAMIQVHVGLAIMAVVSVALFVVERLAA